MKFIPEREINYLPYVSDPIPKWTEFCREFFKEFLSDQVITKFKEQLYLVSKRRKESYIEYYRRIRVTIRRIDPMMSQEEQVKFISNGLKTDPNFDLIKDIKSFNEF